MGHEHERDWNEWDYSAIAGMLLFFVVGCFGIANWHCYVHPIKPYIVEKEPPEQFQARWTRYEDECIKADNGDGAFVPFVVVIPLTFGSFLAAIICVSVLLYRHSS